MGNRVEVVWGGEGEFNEFEVVLDGGVYGVVCCIFDFCVEDSICFVFGKLIEYFVEFGVGLYV